MSHTPGPWSAGIDHVYGKHGLIARAFDAGAETEDEVCANAQLIAAAPEMLEALEKFLAQFSDEKCDCDNGEGDCVFCLAEKAVKKARGE
jgi:hypothetical protein